MAKKLPALSSSPYIQYFESFKQSGTIKDFSHYIQEIEKNPFFKKLLDSFPCTLCITDYQTQQYLYMNENVKMLSGYSAKEILKNGVLFWISRFHPDDLQEFANQSFSKLLTSLHQLTEEEIKQCKISYTYRIKRKDGAWIQVLQNSFILEMDEARNPLLLFVIAFDITPYKKDNTVTLNITHYDYKNDIIKYITQHFNNCKNTSERENEIIRHITNGATAKQIANKMCLSVYTIQAHKRNIFTKTKTTNIAELTNYAFANGII